MRTAPWTLALALLAACGPAEKDEARLQAFDVVTPPGRLVFLEAKLERNGPLGLHPDVHDATLVFTHEGKELDRPKTDRDGKARVRWTPPGDGPKVLEVQVSLPADAKLAAPVAKLRVFVRDPKRPVLVVDLDGTICAASALDVARKEPKDLPAMPGSVDALNALAGRFDILYLTARDDALFARSVAWLQLNRFPTGPVLVRDLSLTKLSAERFKRETLIALAKDLKLVAGVGDREDDGDAYVAAGLQALLIGPGRTPQGAHRFDGWPAIRTELEKLAPAAKKD